MQLSKFGFAESGWTALNDTRDNAANGVAGSFHLFNEANHLFCLIDIRTTNDVTFNLIQIVLCVIAVQGDASHL